LIFKYNLYLFQYNIFFKKNFHSTVFFFFLHYMKAAEVFNDWRLAANWNEIAATTCFCSLEWKSNVFFWHDHIDNTKCHSTYERACALTFTIVLLYLRPYHMVWWRNTLWMVYWNEKKHIFLKTYTNINL
jgi:hypothetical protein